MQIGIYFDISRCTGCYSCEIACKQKNNLEPHVEAIPGSAGPRWRRVLELETGQYPEEHVNYVSLAFENCDLCSDRVKVGKSPACVASCPTKALKFGLVEELVKLPSEKASKELAGGSQPSFFIQLFSSY